MSKFVSPTPGISQDELAFYRAIWDAPQDDSPRLIFADWLDENGKERQAKLIRLDVKFNRSNDRKRRKEIFFEFIRINTGKSPVLLPFHTIAGSFHAHPVGLTFDPWIVWDIPEFHDFMESKLEPINQALATGIPIPENYVIEVLQLPTLPNFDQS